MFHSHHHDRHRVETRALITAPTADVVARDAVKRHLRVDFDDDDMLIDGLIAVAVNMLDPAGGGTLGRALRPQTWEYRLNGFLGHHHHHHAVSQIDLPYAPLISVTSVKYDDLAGVEQTLVADTDFEVIGLGSLGKQSLRPVYGRCWPAPRCVPESVRIRFQCGYPPASTDPTVVDTLPAPIRAWLLLVIGTLYANRESAVLESSRGAVVTLPDHIMQMISPYRVY